MTKSEIVEAALKLALDALETELSIDWTNNDEFNASAEKMHEAIAAIKEALAQTQEPVGDEWTPCMKLPVVVYVRKQRLGESHVSTREGITPVKPDDLIMRGVSGEEYPIGRAIFERTYSFNTTPPQRTEQEPKPATVFDDMDDDIPDLCCQQYDTCLKPCTPRGVHLAQRTWVGLTDDEMEATFIQCGGRWSGDFWKIEDADFHPFLRTIEAKLKEKNT